MPPRVGVLAPDVGPASVVALQGDRKRFAAYAGVTWLDPQGVEPGGAALIGGAELPRAKLGGCTGRRVVDADQVAGGIAECAVAHPIWLPGRFLDDFGAAGCDSRKYAIEVGSGQED